MRVIFLTAFLLAAPAFAADPIANAKAAEFSLHRIERLVILHKIDASYQTQIARIDLALQSPQEPADPTFIIRASQVPGADGTSRTIDLTFDAIGRPMNFTVAAGADSQNPPAWPLKDAITIAENSLHWLEDQGPLVDELKPFFQGMTAFVLSPVINDQGALSGAVVAYTVSRGQPTLLVSMGLDGVFQSYVLAR
jgi:hypothetical protein